ncbi:MAG TPA: FAD-dependent oxidoreductase [Candidatus Paceibacterota bacterium]|nr:FAD-dependent oxidoreductase [Candidatus Paceibacterota bacterium]
MNTRPRWWETVTLPTYPKLRENLRTEVCIVGGGLAGLMSAYLLAKAGRHVVLLEKKGIAWGATGATTAFLEQLIDTDVKDQIEMIGKEHTKHVWQSHGAAIDLIERIANDEGIECEFTRCPAYVFGTSRGEARDLKDEFAAMKGLGFPVFEYTKKLPFDQRYAFEIRNQAKYHPLKFINGLLPKLADMGVKLYEKSEVTKITGKGPFKVHTTGFLVRADATVTTTYQPFNNPKEVFLKKGMYKTYLVEFRVPKGKYPVAVYEDADNPYHYFRIDRNGDHDLLLLGGEDHRIEIKMKEEKAYASLEEYAEEIFGTRYPVTRRWSGPILEPIDGFAYIGRYAPGQYVATAFSGNGMTYSAISAMIFRDLITGKKNPYAHLYEPSRLPSMTHLWIKGRDYTEELFRGALTDIFKNPKKR